MNKPYDSAQDVLEHIDRVKFYLDKIERCLHKRGIEHDKSKLSEPEKSIFDKLTPELKLLEYGSEEYKKSLEELKLALTHHYANNSHHPEYYVNGINGMNLLDILEMLCDWKASSERHITGNIEKSLKINKARFNISDQLYSILYNTAKEMGWTNHESN